MHPKSQINARSKRDVYGSIAIGYVLAIIFILTPIAQPCGDILKLWLRLAIMAVLFLLVVYVAVRGRHMAFWLTPQVVLLGFMLLGLPSYISQLDQSVCFMAS